MPKKELLDIVDEDDRVLGEVEFLKAHTEGIRHRSVQIFVFENEDYLRSPLLVVQRPKNDAKAPLKLQHSVGGHVGAGRTYYESALEELKEELFSKFDEIPRGINLREIAYFKNEDFPTNKENSCLFTTSYNGAFSFEKKEIWKFFWKGIDEIREGMQRNPSDYTRAFINSMKVFYDSFKGR